MNDAVHAARWRCLMCGALNDQDPEVVRSREDFLCSSCGSIARHRHTALALLAGLASFDQPTPPRVAGISDDYGFAAWVRTVCDYTGFQYHEEPRLDIADVPEDLVASFQIVTTSDVLEHVPPPVHRAFAGLRRLLAPGGLLVVTVPCRDRDGVEHWPEMASGELVDLDDGRIVLDERRADGSVYRHADLVWHGGAGSTLEYRVFDRGWLTTELENAGFVEIREMTTDFPKLGIEYEPWSRVWTARSPR